jgi:hypothetical protein
MEKTIREYSCDFCENKMEEHQFLTIEKGSRYLNRTAGGSLPHGQFCNWEHYLLYLARWSFVKLYTKIK